MYSMPLLQSILTKDYSYVVLTSMRSAVGSMGLDIKIQSLKSPAQVEERVEAFLSSFRSNLAGFTPAQLAELKSALVLKLLERPKNLAEETSRFWYQIEGGYYDFLRSECCTPATSVRRAHNCDRGGGCRDRRESDVG